MHSSFGLLGGFLLGFYFLKILSWGFLHSIIRFQFLALNWQNNMVSGLNVAKLIFMTQIYALTWNRISRSSEFHISGFKIYSFLFFLSKKWPKPQALEQDFKQKGSKQVYKSIQAEIFSFFENI